MTVIGGLKLKIAYKYGPWVPINLIDKVFCSQIEIWGSNSTLKINWCLILMIRVIMDGPTLGQRGAIPPPPPPQIKKKTSIKKLRFAHKKYIYVSPPLKYLDIDLQENK